MINSTASAFGYPDSLVRAFDHWLVLVRPKQVTLGSLVLVAKGEFTAYHSLSEAAFREQREAVAFIDKIISRFVRHEKINYLMLMMVDPLVHFHVIPRYNGTRQWGGREFHDSGWPALPDLGSAQSLAPGEVAAMVAALAASDD